MPNIFTDLNYAPKMETYVSPALGVIDNVGQTLEDRYYRNQGNADKLQIAMQNLEVGEHNQWIKDEALDGFGQIMAEAEETGNFENATQAVRQASKAFASNDMLTAAVKDTASAKAQKIALAKRVEDGDIPQNYADHVLSESKNNTIDAYGQERPNGELYKDENGVIKGQFSLRTPPKWYDISKETDEFLEGFKANEYFGKFKKTDDGWVIDEGTDETKGGYEYGHKTRKVTYEELYKSAKDHLMSNEKYIEQIKFEAGMNKSTIEDMKLRDPDAVKTVRADLKKVGYTHNTLDAMDERELYETYKTESLINSKLTGAVGKHDFEEHEIIKFGLPYAKQLALKKAGRASNGQKLVSSSIPQVRMRGSGIENPNKIPASRNEYNVLTSELTNQNKAETAAIEDLQKQKATALKSQINAGMSAEDAANSAAVKNIENKIHQASRNITANKAKLANVESEYRASAQEMVNQGVLNQDDFDTLMGTAKTVKHGSTQHRSSSRNAVTAIIAALDENEFAEMRYNQKFQMSVRRGALGEHDLDKLKELVGKGKFTQEDYDALASVTNRTNGTGDIGAIRDKVDKFHYKRVNQLRAYPSGIDNSTIYTGKEKAIARKSPLAHTLEKEVKLNLGGFNVETDDGTVIEQSDIKDVHYVMMSEGNTGALGTAFQMAFEVEDPDNPKKTITIPAWVSPVDGTARAGYLDMALQVAVNQGSAEQLNIIHQKVTEDVGFELSRLDNIPFSPNTDQDVTIALLSDGAYATLNRRFGDTAIDEVFTLSYFNKDGSPYAAGASQQMNNIEDVKLSIAGVNNTLLAHQRTLIQNNK